MTSEEYDTKRVIRYYEKTIRDYKLAWYDHSSLALHYGFSDKSKKMSHAERLSNENRILADIAKIKQGDLVLDAGCGVGGSAIWLTKNRGAKVVGITISPSQAKIAQENVNIAGVGDKVKIKEMNFMEANLLGQKFDVVWAIESFCHASDKVKLLDGIFNILKPGGRLIIADGFQKRKIENKKEKNDFKKFINGLAVFKTNYISVFLKQLERAGFINIKSLDKTSEATASARRIFLMCLFVFPVIFVLNKLGLISKIRLQNARAGIYQWKCLKNDLWLYGVVYGEKPKIDF